MTFLGGLVLVDAKVTCDEIPVQEELGMDKPLLTHQGK
jgi:hypothetical protein